MTLRGCSIVALLVTLPLGPPNDQTMVRGPEVGRSDPDTAGLARLRQVWTDAYTAGDAAAMKALYTDDAVRMAYDAPAQVGIDQILAGYVTSFARRVFQPTLSLRSAELWVLDTLALERGTYHEVLRAEGRKSLVEEGKYVVVARRGADGQWRYVWSIFNRDAPARPLR